MSRILIMSSWTSIGHVGLSAAAPVLQALGHEVTQLPTVVLSNHPGWPRSAGQRVPPECLGEMIDAIEANGWLAGHAAFLTGYLPTDAHVRLACNLVGRLAHVGPPPRIIVDPILGDEPKGLYLGEDAALAIRDLLVPLAHVLTPNRFELGWLARRPVGTLAELAAAATALAGGRQQEILVTSPPTPGGDTGVLSVGPEGRMLYRAACLPNVPHGTGDVFSALIAAGLGVDAALGLLQALVEASAGAPHLAIVEAAERWKGAAAIAGVRLAPTEC